MRFDAIKLFGPVALLACGLAWWFVGVDGSPSKRAGSADMPEIGHVSQQQAQQPQYDATPLAPLVDGNRAAVVEGKSLRVGATRTKFSKDGTNRSLGDYLAAGLDEMPPDLALDAARMISYCKALPLLDAANREDSAKAANDPQSQMQLRGDRKGLDELGFECQTVPSGFLDGKQEFQARKRLIKRAYVSGVPGAAVEYAMLPAALLDVPEGELYSRITQDALLGNSESIQMLVENKILRERTDDLTMKVIAFGMQRAANAESNDKSIRVSQASIALSLWQEWSEKNPNSSVPMFGMPGVGGRAIQYPPSFIEPKSEEYMEKSKLFDSAIRSARPKPG